MTGVPSRGFRQFVERARSDEAFAARLRTDPESLIAAYGLTEDEQHALRSQDFARLGALGLDERITRVRPEPDIYVVGAGVRRPGQFTLEGVEALRRCVVLYSTLGSSVEWFLRDLVPRVESVWPLYRPGRCRSEIYEQVAATVLEAACRQRPVGFVTDGNPVVFNYITRRILELAGQQSLDVRILPSLSSIDSVLAHLKYDIAEDGLQVFGASRFVGRQIQPQVDAPCLLLVIGVLGTADVPAMNAPRPGELTPLRDHLLRFYPPDHELVFVESPDWWYQDEQVLRVRLSDLGAVDLRDVQFSTLFIPRVDKAAGDGVSSGGA